MSDEPAFRPNRGTLVALLIASMTVTMGGAAVAAALPLIQDAFPDAGETTIALVISLPSLGTAIAGFPIGALADWWGKAKTLLLSILMFIVFGCSAIFLDDIAVILVGRFLLGASIAGIGTCTAALISEYWFGPQRVRVLGLQSAAMGIGVIFLDTGGGALAAFGWRAPFIIYALVGIPTLLCTAMFVREATPPDRPAEDADDGQGRRENPKAVLLMSLAAIFFMEIAFFMYPTKIAYYLQDIAPGTPAVVAGLFLGLTGVTNTFVGILLPKIRLDSYRMIGLASLLFFAASLSMFFGTEIWAAAIAAMLAGPAIGITIPTVIGWLASISTKENSGKIMGMYSVVMNLGMFSVPFVVVPMIALTGSYGGMYLIGGLIALCLGATYQVFRRMSAGKMKTA